jgi:hypothetical protein
MRATCPANLILLFKETSPSKLCTHFLCLFLCSILQSPLYS